MFYITKIIQKVNESKQDDPNHRGKKKNEWLYRACVGVNAKDGPLSPDSALVITLLSMFISRRKLESK